MAGDRPLNSFPNYLLIKVFFSSKMKFTLIFTLREWSLQFG